MLKRTIVALILAPILVYVVLFAPVIVTALCAGFFCSFAAFELLYKTGLVKNVRMVAYSMIAAFLVCLWSYFGCSGIVAVLGLLVFYMLLFVEIMFSQLKIPFSQVAMCLVAGAVIPFFFSGLVRILCMSYGRYFIMLPFVAAFMPDIGAYFVGVLFGKHKLCPLISPKKTVEGLIGGILFGVLGLVVYGVILQFLFDLSVNYWVVVVIGLASSAFSVFGDLSFSVIKRQTGIKDYGDLFPGHGGVLDRFDSVIIVTPLIEVLLSLIPMIR